MISPSVPIILGNFKGVTDNTIDLLLGESVAANNNNVVTDEYLGILTKELGFSYVGELGSTSVVDTCNAIGGWVDDGGANTAVATNSSAIIGSNCIAITIEDAFTTGLVAHNVLTPVDLSGYTKIGFYIKSSVALNAGDYQFLLDETAACTSPDESLNIPALTANRWEYVTLTFTGATSTRNAVAAIGVKCITEPTSQVVIYIDQVTAISTTTAATAIKTLSNYKKSDGSELLMAGVNGEIYTSADGATWTLIASGLNTSYDVEFVTFEGDCYIMNGSDYCMRYTSAGLVIVYAATTGNAYYMPKGRGGWVHRDSIFALIYATDPVTVRWNDPAKTPDEAAWFPAARSKDLAESTGDYLVKGIKHGDRSVIFMNNTFFVLYGSDSADFDWMPREFNIGCTMGRSVQIKDGYVIFANENGIFKLDESYIPQRISDPIKNKYATFLQPTVTSTYWTQTLEADWEAGTEGTNQFDTNTTTGKIYQEQQTTQASWSAGTIVDCDITTSSGNVYVATNNSQTFGADLASGKTVTATYYDATHLAAYIVDSNSATSWNPSSAPVGYDVSATIDLGAAYTVSRIYVDFSAGSYDYYGIYLYASTDNATWTEVKKWMGAGSVTETFDFTPTSYRYVKIFGDTVATGNPSLYVRSVVVYETYKASGTIVTQSIDKGAALAAGDHWGDFAANVSIPTGGSILFQSSISTNGSTWTDYKTLGTATASGNFTANIDTYETVIATYRYIKIKATLTCDTLRINTPQLHSLMVGGTYLSQTHNTGGSILQWGNYDVTQTVNNQSINHYIRSAATEGGLTSATWNAIQPNDLITELVGNSWVQFKIEFSTTDYTQIPNVDLVTINWITSTQSTVPTTQVSSIVHEDRYYLFGTKSGDTYNNDGIVIDRQWNFQFLNTYPAGCLSMFKEEPYMGSATDKSVYRFLSGNRLVYKATTAAITSYWDTGRFGLESKGNDKWFKELILFFEPATATTNVVIYYDVNNSGTWTSLGTIDLNQGDGEERILFTGYIYGRDIRFRIYNSAESNPFKIIKVECLYSIKPRTY